MSIRSFILLPQGDRKVLRAEFLLTITPLRTLSRAEAPTQGIFKVRAQGFLSRQRAADCGDEVSSSGV